MQDSIEKPSLKILQQKREDILAVAQKHGAKNIRIFGSVARGEADENSDIDFLIDYDLEKITPWFPAGLLLDLESLLGFRVDVVTERGLKKRIRERVLKEAILL
ncbi:MAG: DNA polymerase subunit beta [Synechococcaceae cyanobacterium SM2_3_2]|nr:DNA polymerase subunit beta [Synechococcaceae cyanobacterium SM2_3_2]